MEEDARVGGKSPLRMYSDESILAEQIRGSSQVPVQASFKSAQRSG